MPLFEVAIIKNPTKKEADEGTAQEELLFGPECVLAKDEQSAGMVAIIKAKSRENGKLDEGIMMRSSVLIRPFAEG